MLLQVGNVFSSLVLDDESLKEITDLIELMDTHKYKYRYYSLPLDLDDKEWAWTGNNITKVSSEITIYDLHLLDFPRKDL